MYTKICALWIKSKLSCQLVSESDSLPKRLHRKVENQTNGPGFSSFKLMQFAGSEIEMKNCTNPGLA